MAESLAATTTGTYRGVDVDGVRSFLGVRYGTADRFRPAIAAEPHHGVTDALAYGPAALQFDSRLLPTTSRTGIAELYFPRGQQTEGGPTSEDCLTLNVWAPSSGAGLPVMVWFHGGAFRVGSAAATVAHGAHLAATGRAVVVTVNHRLGIPGFLALGHLLGDDYAQSGVVGLTDLALALEWVAANAGEFGGDPGRVTIFGQSGGGGKVAALLAAPRTRGLFHRAIVQSGAGGALDDEAGRDQTGRVLDALGFRQARDILDCPHQRLMDAQAVLSATGLGPMPVVDGEFLQPQRRSELSRGIPLLVGHTSHDWSFMFADAPWYEALTESGMAGALLDLVPDARPGLISVYRARHPSESPQLLLARIVSDCVLAPVTGALAEERGSQGESVYRYEFAYRADNWRTPIGATHCIDVPFVFDTVDWARIVGDRDDRYELARQVSSAWLSFAESGVPTLPDGSPWPPFAEGAASTVLIDAPHWALTTSSPTRELS